MQQVVDLQNDQDFKAIGVQLLSISPDPIAAWAKEDSDLGITEPTLSDAANKVWVQYGSLAWTMGTGEPGHTFVLVDRSGKVAWVRDYGAPEHGGTMYVKPSEIVRQIGAAL